MYVMYVCYARYLYVLYVMYVGERERDHPQALADQRQTQKP